MSELSQSLEHLVRRHAAGTVLFREGDAGAKMFVIRTGKVNIWKRISESEITLAVLGPGEFFGEMALLEKLPRSAGATVVEDALLVEIEHEHFEPLVRKSGEIYLEMQEQYDPLDVRELAELTGLDEQQAHAIVKRVLAARLAEARKKSGAADTYSSYLALKQRFEYAEE